MEYVDLKGFEAFVAERDLVPEAHRSFYMHWVRRFLRAQFGAEELADKDKVECFSDQLARDSSVKEWQLRQALQAVSLYLDVFLAEGRRLEVGYQRSEAGGQGTAGSRPAACGTGGDAGVSPSKEGKRVGPLIIVFSYSAARAALKVGLGRMALSTSSSSGR